MSVDLSLLSQLNSESLCASLRQIPGEKDAVVEPSLFRLLDRVAGVRLLKVCGVRKIFKLETHQPLVSTATTLVYFITSDQIVLKRALNQIRANVTPGLAFYLLLFPRSLHSLKLLVEEEGLAGIVTPLELTAHFVPLDRNLVSLELSNFFVQTFVHDTLTFVPCVSKALHAFHSLFGPTKNRVALGSVSAKILSQVEVLEQQCSLSLNPQPSDVGRLFIVDRLADPLSLLLSPVTYEALLDEVFGIKCGTLDASKQNIKLQLSSKDKVFEGLRFRHFSSVFSLLGTQAKLLREQQEKASSMSVTEMKSFVQNRLKELQTQSKAVAIHISASELIQKERGHLYEQILPLEFGLVRGQCYKETVDFLDSAMCRMLPNEIVLRLMCLLSLTHNGLHATDLQRLRMQFMQTYGFKYLLTFDVLERNLGWLTSRGSSSSSNSNEAFSAWSQRLGLVSKSMSAEGPQEKSPSFVFNHAYQPLVCKLVSLVLNNANMGDLSKLINHTSVSGRLSETRSDRKMDLILFVGGFTHAEVAALRTLEASVGHLFLVGGTNNVTGQSVINSLLQIADKS